MPDFQGRRIVLTGVSRGIGLVCAKALLEQGAAVLGVGRDSERLNRAIQELSQLGDFAALRVDVGSPSAAALIAEVVEQRWGGLDVLVNNAAVMDWRADFEAEEPEILEQTLRVNLIAPHRLILALLPMLRKSVTPRIVNMSSGAGTFSSLCGGPEGASYKLSKYALNGLTVLYAGMLRGTVAVNSLDPGWLKTDMGGPNAPGEVDEGAKRLLALLRQPASESGKFWLGEYEMKF